jgi:SagB-type dehydrogenase family enzyme
MGGRKGKILLLLLGVLGVGLLFSFHFFLTGNAQDLRGNTHAAEIMLPPPALDSGFSLERAIYERLSHRNFTERPLTLGEAGQLLWAAYGRSIDGVTGATRTVPSAGATHPLEIYLVAGEVDGLAPGVYRYNLVGHSLIRIATDDRRQRLAAGALNQHFVARAPVSIVLAADYGRTTARYRERGLRYVYMEVGHSTQNIYLQCGPLGLGAVAVGAFDDANVKALLEIGEEPLMIIPVGAITAR